MLLVTFHGGGSGVNSVVAYDDDGTPRPAPVLDGAPPGSELRELMLVPDGLLWVLSGAASDSAILAFTGSGGNYTYQPPPVAQYLDNENGLLHPFDFTFDAAGNVYISNQDSNTVARFVVAKNFLSASPAPVAPALTGRGTFLPGTFVASSNGNLPHAPPTTAIDPPAGLEAWPPSGKLVNSVRGVACANDMLYVADEVASVVKVYDLEGNYQGQSNPVGTPATKTSPPANGPVHLLFVDHDGEQSLVVTNGVHVFSAVLDPTRPAALTLQPITSIKVPKVSGLAIDSTGTLYAASRDATNPEIFKYVNFPQSPAFDSAFPVGAGDVPEFVLHIPDN